MKTLFHKWFFENWQRKYFSLFIAIIAWFVINHSLSSTKTLSNIPVKIVNIPSNKTVLGVQDNGVMEKTISLTFVGNKTALDGLSASAIEVIIDGSEKPDEWVETITKKHIVSTNGELDITNGVSQVVAPSLTFRSLRLISEKIPIVVTQPMGNAPRGYQFLDVWPYRMTLTVKGPEEIVNKLKLKEHTLTFNLNDICKTDLDSVQTYQNSQNTEVISYQVPSHWKQIDIPSLSDSPIQIDDPQASDLRIDFIRYDLLAIDASLPITLFFPHGYRGVLNPSTCSLQQCEMVKNVNGINLLTEPLYAKGVSQLFLEVVQDMMQIQILVSPKGEVANSLGWSVQFVNPRTLEEEYVSRLRAESSDEDSKGFQPILKEVYWRNRFRSYMSRFELFKADGSKLDLKIQLDKDSLIIAKAN